MEKLKRTKNEDKGVISTLFTNCVEHPEFSRELYVSVHCTSCRTVLLTPHVLLSHCIILFEFKVSSIFCLFFNSEVSFNILLPQSPFWKWFIQYLKIILEIYLSYNCQNKRTFLIFYSNVGDLFIFFLLPIFLLCSSRELNLGPCIG